MNQEDTIVGLYRGIVKDTSDPLKLRRVRVQVIPFMENIYDIKALPWAVSKDSRFIDIPEVGSIVWVEFECGDIRKPVYSGFVCDSDRRTIPVEAESGYPDSKVYKVKTPKGVDVLIKIDSSGNITINNNKKNVTINCDKVLLAANEIRLGGADGYVVTCPTPNTQIVTENMVLTSSDKVKA